MKLVLRNLGLISLILGLPILLTACNTVRGGGWIQSANGTTKATFGFNLVCKNDSLSGAQVSGQFEYSDPGAGIALHGVPGQLPSGTICGSGIPSSTGQYYGSYTPESKNQGPGGEYVVFVSDNGTPGPSAGDSFTIQLFGGIYDGYTNSGTLGGGNITSFGS